MSGDTKNSRADLSQVPFEALVREMIVRLDPDPDRDGMDRTPERVAKSMQFLTRGYHMTPEDAIGDGIFVEHHHNMVLVKDIELYSMCEHHLLPFFGKAHVAYIPDGKVVGLSKIPRLVDMFSRRLQVQERLTVDIAEAIEETVKPRGVGVVIEAMHFCMIMRGVEKQNSVAATSCMLGAFRDHQPTREEFLGLIRSRNRPGI